MKEIVHHLCVKIYLSTKKICQYIYGYLMRNRMITKERKTIFLLGTPEHDNLGDHVIALAEIEFIKQYFPEFSIREISVESWRKYFFALKKCIDKEDMLFFTGGGNMGDIYVFDEVMRRVIISSFNDNCTVIFPQTVFFHENEKGAEEIRKSRKVYEQCKRLIICAREETSYRKMKEIFPNCRIECYPDMAFSLSVNQHKNKTNKIGICIRSDKESVLQKEDRDQIIANLSRYKTEVFSTCAEGNVSATERKDRVIDLLNQLSEYDLVITDRLHAFILSVLVGTRCIVMPVKSSKITATMNWLKQNQNVCYLSDIHHFKDELDRMMDVDKEMPFDDLGLELNYMNLAKSIRACCES